MQRTGASCYWQNKAPNYQHPARSGKTELAVIDFIAWATGLYPDSEWIHASYSKRLATNNTYNVRELMQNEAYSDIFPNVRIKQDSAAKDEFKTTDGGVILCGWFRGHNNRLWRWQNALRVWRRLS